MTILAEGVSKDEQEKIEELRDALGEKLLQNTPMFNDDFSLLRWLMDEIVPRYKKISHFAKLLKLNDLPEIQDIDEANEYVVRQQPSAKHFPGGLMGFDSDGNVIYFQMLGKICPRELLKTGKASDLFVLGMKECILLYQIVKQQEKKLNKQIYVKMIVDLEGWRMDMLYMPAVKLYINLIKIIQDVFPELGKILLVINAPSMIGFLYSLFKPALAEATRDKVFFASSDYKNTLLSELGAENVFEKWDGLKVPKNGLPTGSLRIGGSPGDALKYDPSKNPYHVDVKKLTKINVRAGQKSEISFDVTKPNSILRWFFWVNGEIDFSVQHDNEEVWPKFRLNTEYVPEFGSIECENLGTYSLVFDNSLSTFFSKDIKYFVVVE